MEQTLVIIKPDAFSKRMVGKIIDRFEKENFRMVACRMVFLSEKEAKLFYKEHQAKKFYLPLVDFISSNPFLVMVWKGDKVVSKMRKIIGNTDPNLAEEGTVRRMYANDNRHNVVHSSDSQKSAEREIELFFSKEEIYNWEDKEYKK